MSKKAKYKAVKDAMNPGTWFVESPRDIICQRCTMSSARKIARALNAIEDKPKSKPFKFDWSGIDPEYRFAAMDPDKVWMVYANLPNPTHWWKLAGGVCEMIEGIQPYPGDWRNSLQKRPSK